MNKTEILLKACKSGLNDFFQSGLGKVDLEKVKKITVYSNADYDNLRWLAEKMKLTISIQHKNSDGFWRKWEYENGLLVRIETSTGSWEEWRYENGLLVHYENSEGYKEKWKYENRLKTYCENSNGYKEKWRYENRLLVHYENSENEKGKWEYNENGDLIYFTNFTERDIKINIEYKE